MAFVILRKTTTLSNSLNNCSSQTFQSIFHKNNIINQLSRVANCSTSIQTNKTFENEVQSNLKTINSDNLDDAIEISLPKPLDECKEDLSHIGPYETPSFNFAKYANNSPMLQKLVKLGVDLSKVEAKSGAMKALVSLDFDQHVKPYIQFYHDCGVPVEEIGHVFTKNPFIFKTPLNHLSTRIKYLEAHKFNPEMITRIITKNPYWLSYDSTNIDKRLGYFQHTFALSGDEVRLLTIKHPKLITNNTMQIEGNTFAIKEEMGFDKVQCKMLLIQSPYLWTKSRVKLLETFDYAHNQMGITHEMILNEPNVLLCKKPRLEQRHTFMVELKKAQYDPEKPLYVSPFTLVSCNDEEFCINVAQVPIDTYNKFLKTF